VNWGGGVTANCCFMRDLFLDHVPVSDILVSPFFLEFINISCEAFYGFSIPMEANLMVPLDHVFLCM
jgi:hypothetical protein